MGNGTLNLTLEQQAIRDKCFHPAGEFIEFNKEEIEQSQKDLRIPYTDIPTALLLKLKTLS